MVKSLPEGGAGGGGPSGGSSLLGGGGGYGGTCSPSGANIHSPSVVILFYSSKF